ncbi:Membrane protein [Nymphaea thermarum]|nr:Membrane protein [Nymphaea thermarum]
MLGDQVAEGTNHGDGGRRAATSSEGSAGVGRCKAFMASCCTYICSKLNAETARHVYGLMAKYLRICLYSKPSPTMARYLYSMMFVVTNLIAWIVRDYGRGLLSDLSKLKVCGGGGYCLGAEGVLRVSLGSVIFFFMMLLLTVGTIKLDDPRGTWHCSWWSAKILLWFVLTLLQFLAPSDWIQLYGKPYTIIRRLAHWGAGVFLVIQLFSVISFISWFNNCMRSDKHKKMCRLQILYISIAAYAATFLGIVLMYVWYAPTSSCKTNIFLITWTLVLIIIITWVSIHPKSFIIAFIAIAIATFSAGIDYKTFRFRKVEPQSEDNVPYGYGFFHFVFAIGTMYSAMLLIGWNVHQTLEKWTIDVGWTSTWVRVLNEWLAAGVYVWMLIAPLVWKNRLSLQTSS